ncbi:hypothetical protein ABZ547_22885 [Streptomyces sparsogenes]|uniref:hypothetical protein n=1 Tax=Streptomyces sparsogenes TaxID=67365 RepID=UPI0033F98B3A
MRALRTAGAAFALCAALFAGAPVAAADASPSASAGADGDDGPTEAGTGFRTATAIEQGQTATASASAGDYLYWVFPAAAGQVPTVKANIKLPEAQARHGKTTWRLDVYDGLRRRQACTSGAQTATAAPGDASLDLGCRIRRVRPWSEAWANEPLPGSYYVRLTVVDLPEQDLGLPFTTEVTASTRDTGGAHAEGGELSPLTPAVRAGATQAPDAGASPDATESPTGSPGGDDSSSNTAAAAEPDGGWGAGWWSDRWVWTVAGGALGALAGVGGYALSRGRRSFRSPPAAE